MAFGGRPESFLPSIKCSSCAADIPMDALADHICATTTPPVQPKPTRNFFDRLGATAGGAQSHLTPDRGPFAPKSGWPNPPPRIDAAAAKDRSFSSPSVPAANSSSNHFDSPQFESPQTPASELRSPGAEIYDSSSQTMLNPHDTLADNEIPFPPYPPRSDDHPPPQAKSSRSNSPINPNPPRNPRIQDDGYRDVPHGNQSQNVIKRLNTISPGPFSKGNNANSSGGSGFAGSRHQRNKTSESLKDFYSHQRTTEALKRPSTANPANQRDTYANLAMSNPFGQADASSTSNDPPRPRTANSRSSKAVNTIDDFLNGLDDSDHSPGPHAKLQQDRYGSKNNQSNPYAYTNSGADDDVQLLEPLTYDGSSSRDRSRTDPRIGGAPPVPAIPAIQRQFPGIASSHSPTDSSSSGVSDVFSSHTSQSSRSSPPGSDVGDWSRRPSDTSTHGASVSASSSLRGRERGGPTASKPLPAPIEPSIPTTRRRSNTSGSRSGSTSFRRPSRGDAITPPPLPPPLPVEPTIQPAAFTPAAQRRPSVPDTHRPSPLYTSHHDPPSRKAQTPIDDHNWQAPLTSQQQQPQPRSNPAPVPTSTNPTVNKNIAQRAPCRGCGALIIGRAIRATDGRLSGRWHRECFTCQTCRAPFPTADFYVLDDRPYCEHHYHTLNGSLCQACNTGIEGMYLETDRGGKFHKGCLTCGVCDIPLRDEYYEIKEKVYCERHAWSVAQKYTGSESNGSTDRRYGGAGGAGAAGRGLMQKRTTRLMDMGFGGSGGSPALPSGGSTLPSLSENDHGHGQQEPEYGRGREHGYGHAHNYGNGVGNSLPPLSENGPPVHGYGGRGPAPLPPLSENGHALYNYGRGGAGPGAGGRQAYPMDSGGSWI